MLNEFRGKARKHWNPAKMILERATAVGLIELCAKRFVLEHDVQHIAQHLVRDDAGLRNPRRRPRIKIHAGHFAEQISRAKLGHGIAIREINAGINGNRPVGRFFFALILLASDEVARQPLEETFGSALGLDVSNGCGNGDSRLPLNNIKRRGSELSLAANHFALAKAPLDDGAAIQLQKGSRDALEDGSLQKLFCFKNLCARAGGNGGSRKAFVGERTRGTGNHALAAGNARGISHRRIQIKSDARGIAFTHAAKNEIALDFVAAANAAVAQNARIVIYSDGERGIILAAGDGALWKPQRGYPRGFRERFEFAIARLLLPR